MNALLASGLYTGVVSHVRTRPRRHALRYRVFMALVDLDELDELNGRLRLFKANRPGLMSFQEKDHGGGETVGLKSRIQAALVMAGLPVGGPIRLLCLPRVLGFVFNPLSVYFCHGADGSLSAILYEVNNTFGERHAYLIATPDASNAVIEQGCEKRFFVSPFMGMDMTYGFKITPPGEDVRVVVNGFDQEGLLLNANFAGKRRELTDGAVIKAMLGHPLLTLMVVAGIHWEALKLFLKGVRLVARPPAPPEPVTVVR